MVKQFDIAVIDLDPARGHEKGKTRPVLIVSNEMMTESAGFVWAMPITERDAKYPMDLKLKTEKNAVQGIIDTVQIRCLDFDNRNGRVVDHLVEDLHQDVLDTIMAHIDPDWY